MHNINCSKTPEKRICLDKEEDGNVRIYKKF